MDSFRGVGPAAGIAPASPREAREIAWTNDAFALDSGKLPRLTCLRNLYEMVSTECAIAGAGSRFSGFAAPLEYPKEAVMLSPCAQECDSLPPRG
jgi:hypothetical protein